MEGGGGYSRKSAMGKKGCLSKVRLQVVRQVVSDGARQRAMVKLQKSVCLSQTHISDAGFVIKSWSETTAMGMGLLPKCTEMNPNKRK
jgi:hypothetical protein